MSNTAKHILYVLSHICEWVRGIVKWAKKPPQSMNDLGQPSVYFEKYILFSDWLYTYQIQYRGSFKVFVHIGR